MLDPAKLESAVPHLTRAAECQLDLLVTTDEYQNGLRQQVLAQLVEVLSLLGRADDAESWTARYSAEG